ncbi:hypothetical protein KK141_19485 [Dyella sp. LX-66]|uniref:hypothetical protein n=1 Tax=unclassified Dyella TaxID=2634549 RepID=UPI001BE0B421|nr:MULTISPECIES: hypothetical protein [unclassified Dyella]MBT2119544.1 hypothetical protein [Dyella sp. LX-1]MBT2141740.1 hypothetical protein [Dyella sp. LX-66]
MFCIDRAHWLYNFAHTGNLVLLALIIGHVSGAFFAGWFRVTRLRIKRRMRGLA